MAETNQAASPEKDAAAMRETSAPALGQEHQHAHELTPTQSRLDHKNGASLDIESASARKPPAYGTNSDSEKAGAEAEEQAEYRSGWIMRTYRRHRWVGHLFVFALFTGWWIASLVLHRHDKNWVVPFLLWLAITLRLIFWHAPISIVSRPLKWTWRHTGVFVYERLPPWSRTPLGAFVAIAAVLIGTFVTEERADNNRANRAVSLFGIAVLLFGLWATSRKRSAIQWRTVIGGMLSQYIVALFVLRTGVGFDIFKFIADRAADLLGFARDGTAFLTDEETSNIGWFFISVIPAIMFFISLVQVLYYIGFLQWFIKKFAIFVFWFLRVSGAEAVVAAATPFIGQGESAMLVRPFVPHMTNAEIHQILTCGFATISGSVLVAYMSLGLNPQALVSSCIMSIPASLAISKMRYPETEETLTAGYVEMPEDEDGKAENALHAFANGAWFGIKIAGTIIATLLCIIAAVALCDGLLGWWGRYLNINDPQLSLELIMSYICYPISFLLGVPRTGDLYRVAKIIATKIVKNEYAAFEALSAETELSPRSHLIATYAICGFGNFGSLGIQVGILSQIAPSRGGDVSRLAFSAFTTGVLSTLTSAAVAGLVVSDEAAFLGS